MMEQKAKTFSGKLLRVMESKGFGVYPALALFLWYDRAGEALGMVRCKRRRGGTMRHQNRIEPHRGSRGVFGWGCTHNLSCHSYMAIGRVYS